MNSYTWRAGIIKSDLLSTTRHVLLTLSCHVNDAGESAYPSTALLAKETGLSERSVITHLSIAKDLGWLEVRKHGLSGQSWARNEYYPRFPDDKKGTEPLSPPCKKGTESLSEGTEPDDKKALNDVQSNYSYELPEELPVDGTPKKVENTLPTMCRLAREAVSKTTLSSKDVAIIKAWDGISLEEITAACEIAKERKARSVPYIDAVLRETNDKKIPEKQAPVQTPEQIALYRANLAYYEGKECLS